MKHGAHPHEKPHHPHWPLETLLFAFVFALGWRSVHAPETWIHLKTGAKIIAEHRLPRTDPFGYGSADGAWTTDSWLFDVAAAKLDQIGGVTAVVLVKSLAAAAAFALLLPINHGSPLAAASLLALGACAGWTGLVEAPAVLDLLFFALFIRLLRPRHRFRWWQGAAAAALTALWANTHGASSLLALWLVGLKVFKASLRTTARERLGYWATLAVCVLTIAWNPLGWSIIGRTFADATTVVGGWPADWLSLYTLFAVAGLASCWYTLQQEFVTTVAAATVIALSFVLPGLRPLAILAACPVIALALGHWLKARADTWPRVMRWAVFAGFLLAGYQHFVAAPLSRTRGYGSPVLGGAAHYLKSNSVRGRMFNEPETGAELIGLSERPVFVDARPGVYPAAFKREAAAWPRLFRQLDMVYRFDYAVVHNHRAGAPARIIDEDPNWALVYADDRALVYLKRAGENAWLVPAERRLVFPNRMWPDSLDPLLADKRTAGKVLEELDRWLVQAPDCVQALIWKAYVLGRLGLSDKADRHLELARERPRLRRDSELLAAYAFALEARGRLPEARAAYHSAVESAQRLNEPRVEAEILPRLAALQRKLGNEGAAREAEARVKALPAPVEPEE
ncbi:MAG: tetratricopeptide repeat protein [Elusimicrobia bacterium]|nr:tetratricopeptide repeat protein [Elusimicrobiota bacterium]